MYNDITGKLLYLDLEGKITHNADIDNFEWYQLSMEFNMPYNNHEIGVYDPYNKKTKSLSFKYGDIIGMCSYKYQSSIQYYKYQIVNMVLFNNKLYPTGVSKEFIEANYKIFKNITQSIIRESKLNKIFENA